MPPPRFLQRIHAQPLHSIYSRFITPTMHPHSSLARAIHCPLLLRALPAAKLIKAFPIQSLRCLCRALRINAVPLLNQTVPSLSATLPSASSQCPHISMQFLTSPWPCESLPRVALPLPNPSMLRLYPSQCICTLPRPFASSPSRSGLCCFGAVQRFGCSVRHHYQPQQCSALASLCRSEQCVTPASRN